MVTRSQHLILREDPGEVASPPRLSRTLRVQRSQACPSLADQRSRACLSTADQSEPAEAQQDLLGPKVASLPKLSRQGRELAQAQQDHPCLDTGKRISSKPSWKAPLYGKQRKIQGKENKTSLEETSPPTRETWIRKRIPARSADRR